MSQFTNLWRTLIRVAAVDEHKCCVLIPAWNTSEIICIDISNIPEDIRPVLWPGKRLHAEVNIGAEKAEDLMFANWEKDQPIMRYFSWNEPSEIYGDIILTVSEENILKRYFPIWKEKVIRHTQIDEVEKARLLSDKVHCLEDFISCNWAWETTEFFDRKKD